MSARQTAALVSSALAIAVDTRAPRAVVLHSDRGCQYTVLGYRSPAEFERRWHEQREPVRL